MLKIENAHRYVAVTLLFTFFIKLLLCKIVPVTGDEAYYAIWGIFPAWGGYDHTPFIGWLLYPFLLISKNPIMLRLPAVLATSLIGWVIYLYGRNIDKEKAAYASIAFLVSPLSLCGILITTDIPVILFSFLSGICVLKALEKNDHLGWFALGGLSLGLAFFSKYFAVLLALSYFIYLVIIAPTRKRILGLFILFLGVLPFGLENLWWNYHHAWANILFNVYNRNVEDHFGFGTFLSYLVTLFYIITPPLFYYLLKYPRKVFERKAVNIFILVPLIFFLILSTRKEIGLHWPLAFITFIYIWAMASLNLEELKKTTRFLIWFTLTHLFIIFALALTPMQYFHKLPISDKFYTKLVFFFQHEKITQYLQTHYPHFVYSSLNYVQADMMFYDNGLYSPTFGKGDVHGRQDDLMTDFKTYDHKNFLLFYSRPPRANEYEPYFAHSEVHSFNLAGATFYYVLGYDFNYVAYRESVLKYINDTYWQIPSYLPHAKSFFCERYFSDGGCQ